MNSLVFGVREQGGAVPLDKGREAEQRGGALCTCDTSLAMTASNWRGERERERERETELQRERERGRERERERERKRKEREGVS